MPTFPCSHARCRTQSKCKRKPRTILEVQPRMIKMHQHWRGPFIPMGRISSERFPRLFTESVRTRQRFAKHDDVLLLLDTKPRSIPQEHFEAFLKLARFKEFVVLVKNVDVTSNPST